jgi:hypothetical protein
MCAGAGQADDAGILEGETGAAGGAQDRVDGAGGRVLPWADASFVNPPRLKHMTVRRYRRQLARVFEQDGRADGADGHHARAGRLAVELVSLSQPSVAGGSTAIDG